MKKRELKNIIKECVREVMFEDGMLSGIISEVVQGVTPVVGSSAQPPRQDSSHSRALAETKRQVLTAIGSNSYDEAKKKFKNPELFENTKPIPNGNGQGALGGVNPQDPGVDINNLPGFGAWGRIATGKE